MRLENQRIFVTGGSRGLGQAMCVAFATEGARVAFTYMRDEDGKNATLEKMAAAGKPGLAFKGSVLDKTATAEAVAEVEETWGAIDVLVNNAGITQNLPLALLEEEDWDKVMDVNVKGTFLTTKSVVRGMIRQKAGTILNIGSIAGQRALDAPIHYAASKGAIAGFSLALSKQLARYGIRVNCLAPGLLDDGVGRNIPDNRLAEYLTHCSKGRLGTLDEVARRIQVV